MQVKEILEIFSKFQVVKKGHTKVCLFCCSSFKKIWWENNRCNYFIFRYSSEVSVIEDEKENQLSCGENNAVQGGLVLTLTAGKILEEIPTIQEGKK